MRELEDLARGGGPAGYRTTLALHRGDRTVLAHNEDWSAIDLETTMLLHDVTVPDGTRAAFATVRRPCPLESGMNSHGLAITANTLPTTDARPGVANAFVLRRVLESRSLEEVWERVQLPERGLGTYVLAGDAQGRAWAMEHPRSRRPVDLSRPGRPNATTSHMSSWCR